MKLIYPEEKYLKFYQEARLEHELNGVTTYDFLDSSKVDIFEMVFNFRHNIDLPPNYVPSTYLWMVEGSEFIGEINNRIKKGVEFLNEKKYFDTSYNIIIFFSFRLSK